MPGLGTANLDYNGRLCIVSAGRRQEGPRRGPANPWSDIPLIDVVFVAGANIAECVPITTSYIWRARDNGAKLIVMDPPVESASRTADVFLGVRPGTDLAVLSAMFKVLIDRDWLNHEFIEMHTNGFDDAAAAVAEATTTWAEAISGVPAARIEQAVRNGANRRSWLKRGIPTQRPVPAELPGQRTASPFLHMAEVTGSIPVSPTTRNPRRRGVSARRERGG